MCHCCWSKLVTNISFIIKRLSKFDKFATQFYYLFQKQQSYNPYTIDTRLTLSRLGGHLGGVYVTFGKPVRRLRGTYLDCVSKGNVAPHVMTVQSDSE